MSGSFRLALVLVSQNLGMISLWGMFWRMRVIGTRAHLNVCDISIVWHREGERDKGGNAGIDGRMQAMAKAAQQEFSALLDAKRLAYARIDEIDGNLMVGIRRRLWDITDEATGRQWSLETAVESVTKNVLFLRQQVESRLVRIIRDQPRGRPRRAKRTR